MSASPSIVELLETPEAFRRWLRAKKALEIVGEKGCDRCPLARFLLSHRPDTRCNVGKNHFWVAWGRPVELPAWASAFVQAADDFMADSEAGRRPRIYAADALDLLDESTGRRRSDHLGRGR